MEQTVKVVSCYADGTARVVHIRQSACSGDCEVIFAGKDEVITLSHSAASRELFATGALKAAEFIVGKDAGMYCMDDLLKDI